VRDVTAAGNTFGYQGTTGMGFGADGKSFQINVFPVEANHIEFFDLELLAGRDFDPARSSDTTEAILVNEALIRSFELVDPLGKQIPYADKHRIEGRIVGVVKDYNFQALYQQVGAAVLTLKDYWGFDKLFVRLGDDPQQGIARLREAWNEVVPGIPLEYRFLDDRLADVYSVEQRWSRVARYGAIFATVIACLGLLGLTVLTITGRIKEIGIRKVLGASSGHIVQLISRDFGKLVGVGFVIAAPLAFLALTQFLNLYAFHIPLGPNVFIVAGVLMGVLAFSTVGILTLKASQQDPVDSLRCE
jgi:putative ABC transport system permease protein